ncbi:exonuclease domain-containing protein [Streptomyces sp. NEAU-Y11]|uniref:exonuclease domain-containing protein n=1 Tax=Streptomyces cucumeris TaxID=2962890 RepID=UPI0020C84AC6|nr:exonuclease domain-containing protein [Streptomyces sp. NEAU-Y11]MCP9205549.1 exonuclease domain-containing protein [Streptomyces sp. NEAU-Y11]
MSWHLGRLCGYDLETTGPDPGTARIVTACVVQVGGDRPAQAANWLSDVDGEEIPAEAERIHGVTTERARAEGTDLREVVEQLLGALSQVVLSGVPIVAMNARYDLTVIDREARRYGMTPLTDTVGDGLRVVDPYVIDKRFDTYRKGKRTLTHLCQHYQVRLDGAHSSDADALAACRVVWRQGQRYERLAAMTLDELHAAQVEWAAEQAASFQEHLRTKDPEAYVEPAWPLVPHQAEGGDR